MEAFLQTLDDALEELVSNIHALFSDAPYGDVESQPEVTDDHLE